MRLKRHGSFSWARRLDGVALFAFAAGVNFLFGQGEQRMLGIAMVISFPLAHLFRLPRVLQRALPVPLEIKLYSAWVVWSGLTGPLVAVNLDLFWTGYQVLLQMFVMVWSAYLVLSNLDDVDIVFLAIFVGGLVQVILVLLGGGLDSLELDLTKRTMGSTSNPNALGFLMNWLVLCAIMLWKKSPRWQRVWRFLVLAIIPLAAYVILSSGSRKSTIAFGFLIFGWATFGRRTVSGIRNILASLVVGGILLVSFAEVLPAFLERTTVGYRFQIFFNSGRGDLGQAIKSQDRYDMYVDGLRIFFEYPVFGVGINNFQKHFIGGECYSHSNYIEPLATTGLIGFVLYHAFYVLLLFRIHWLLNITKESLTRYRLKVMLLGILSMMIIGFGAPQFTMQAVFLLLTAFSVFTTRLQRRYSTNRTNGRTRDFERKKRI